MFEGIHLYIFSLLFVFLFSAYSTFLSTLVYEQQKYEIKIFIFEHYKKLLFLCFVVSFFINGFQQTMSYILRDFIIGIVFYIIIEKLKYTKSDRIFLIYNTLKSNDIFIEDVEDNIEIFKTACEEYMSHKANNINLELLSLDDLESVSKEIYEKYTRLKIRKIAESLLK